MSTSLFEAVFNGIAGSVTEQGLEKHSSFASGDLTRTGDGTAYSSGTGNAVLLPTAVGDREEAYIRAGLSIKSLLGSGDAYASLGARMSNSLVQWHTQGVNYPGAYPQFGYDTAYGNYTHTPGSSTYRPFFPVGPLELALHMRGSGGTNIFQTFINRREVSRYCSGMANTGKVGIITGGPVSSTTGTHYTSLGVWDTPPRPYVLFLGDSMTIGDYSVAGPAVKNVGYNNQWPTKVMDRLLLRGFDADYSNLGCSGKRASVTYSDRETYTQNTQGLAQTEGQSGVSLGFAWGANYRAGVSNTAVVKLGYNDILQDGASGATAAGNVQSIVEYLVAQGYRVVPITLAHCLEGAHAAFTVPAGTNSKIDAFNDILLNNAVSVWGALSVGDVHTDPRISTDWTGDYRDLLDGVHYIAAAMEPMADLVEPLVAAASAFDTDAPGWRLSSRSVVWPLNKRA